MDKHAMTAGNTQALMDITQNTIYLMGASFVLGSLFSLFLLMVLDFIRRNKTEKPS